MISNQIFKTKISLKLIRIILAIGWMFCFVWKIEWTASRQAGLTWTWLQACVCVCVCMVIVICRWKWFEQGILFSSIADTWIVGFDHWHCITFGEIFALQLLFVLMKKKIKLFIQQIYRHTFELVGANVNRMFFIRFLSPFDTPVGHIWISSGKSASACKNVIKSTSIR